MKSFILKALASAALATLALAAPAVAADNFTPTNSVNQNFRSKDIGSGTALHIPFQIPSDVLGNPLFATGHEGYVILNGTLPAFATTPTFNVGTIGGIAKESGGNLDAINGKLPAIGQKAKAGSVAVALPVDPDILNTAATITAADAASTTATGQNGVSVVSGTPTTGSAYSYAVNGQSEADFTVTSTFTGTLVFEGSANGGLTWTPRSAHVMGTKYRTSTITAPGIFHINAAGLTNIRARATALASGTPSVQLNTTSGTGSIYVMNPIELTDNTTGLSASIKAGGSAASSDPAITVYDAVIAALTGSPSDTAYTGTGNPSSLFGLFKGIFGQAAPVSNPGTSIGNTTPVPGFQGVTGGIKVGVDTIIQGVGADAGGTIATANTAQTFMASNTSRRAWSLQNQSTGDLYVNCSAAATADYHSLKVPAGALYESATTHVSTGACSVIGATAGQAFYARQF